MKWFRQENQPETTLICDVSITLPRFPSCKSLTFPFPFLLKFLSNCTCQMHGNAIANDQVSFCILLQRQVVLSKKEKRLGVEKTFQRN
jgi:hypothetical protein